MRSTVVVLIAALLAYSSQADACSCIGLPYADDQVIEFAKMSDMVFVATVLERVRGESVNENVLSMETKARVMVTEGFVGAEQGKEVELWTEAPTCSATFRPNTSYLFFVTRSIEDGLLYTNLCSSFQFTPQKSGDPIPQDPDRGRIMQAILTLRSAFS